MPVSLPDNNGKVALTVPLGPVPTRFRLPLTMSVYELICDLKHELHWSPPPAPSSSSTSSSSASSSPASAPAAAPSARRVRVLDNAGAEMDQSLPLSEALQQGAFTIDLGHTAIAPDGRAFTDYLRSLKVEQGELRAERDVLDGLEALANRRSERRNLAARLGFGAFLYGQLGVIVYLTYDIGWDIMEPTTYLLGLASAILGYTVYLYTHQDFSFAIHMEGVLERLRQRHLVRLGYDAQRRVYVHDRLERLERLLRLYEKESVRFRPTASPPSSSPLFSSSSSVAEV